MYLKLLIQPSKISYISFKSLKNDRPELYSPWIPSAIKRKLPVSTQQFHLRLTVDNLILYLKSFSPHLPYTYKSNILLDLYSH